MKQVDGWTQNQLKAEFAKASAEIAGIKPKQNDAYERKRKASARLEELKKQPPPEPFT